MARDETIIAFNDAFVFRNGGNAETPTINALTMIGAGRDQCSIEGTADHRRLELKSGDKVVPCGRTIIVERYTDLVIHLLLKFCERLVENLFWRLVFLFGDDAMPSQLCR